MEFSAFPAVVCKCGHDLIIGPADPATDGISAYNFLGHCANEQVCDTLDWVVTITATPSVTALSTGAICHHPVGNGECVLEAGHAGSHRLTLPEPEPEPAEATA